MKREEFKMKIGASRLWIVVLRRITYRGAGVSLLEKSSSEGERPMQHLQSTVYGMLS